MGLCPKGCSKIEFDSNGIISKKIQEQELLGYNSKSPKRESFLRGDSKEMFWVSVSLTQDFPEPLGRYFIMWISE